MKGKVANVFKSKVRVLVGSKRGILVGGVKGRVSEIEFLEGLSD